MTNSSVTNAGQQDVATISALNTLDEMDGSGYVRKTLTTLTVTEDDTNHRAIFTSDAPTWTTMAAGTRSIKRHPYLLGPCRYELR